MALFNNYKRKKAFAVFEGGGVKGIGIAGALEVAEEFYQWQNVAGTSAGSIIAALVAAGYSAESIKKMIISMDFSRWQDAYNTSEVPIAGPAYNFIARYGMYKGQFIEDWIRERLAEKGVRTFGDLICSKDETLKYRLQVVASDISRGRMVILPRDLRYYGINPDEFPVARAIRMSCAIPFFFSPVRLKYTDINGLERISFFVDGGVLSNFPLWLFEENRSKTTTVGFRLVGPNEGLPRNITGPLSFFGSIISTMMEAHDARYMESKSSAKTISIPTLGVRATDFHITDKLKNELYASGRLAAQAYFNNWSLKYYVQRLLG